MQTAPRALLMGFPHGIIVADKMKILVLTESLGLGGAETMAVALANALSLTDGIEVVFSSAAGPLQNRLSSNIKYYPIQKFSFSAIVSVLRQITEIVNNAGPDIIHAHGATVGILAGFVARRMDKRIKIVLTHHSKTFSRIPEWLSILLIKRYCDFFVAISKAKMRNLIALGIPPEKLMFVPNFLDSILICDLLKASTREKTREKLNIPLDSIVLVMAGRLLPQKRFDKFIKITELFANKTDNPVYGLILGDGDERFRLEKLAKELSRGAQIQFLGYQKNVFEFLAASDVFLFPSHHEVLPMALLEACAVGLPIVCSNIAGNDEIVENGGNGFLIDGGDNDYCDAVSKIINDTALATKMKQNARTLVLERFDKRKVLNSLVSLYTILARN